MDTGSARIWVWDVGLVLVARVAGATAAALTLFALTVRVHDAGGGAGQVAAVMCAFALPGFLAMGAAGHVADRYDSRLVLTVTGGVQAAALAALTVAHVVGARYVLVVVAALAQTVAGPVWAALLPMVTGEESYGRVAARQMGAISVAAVVAAGTAGAIASRWGTDAVLWLAVGSSVVLTVCAVLVRARRGGGPDVGRERRSLIAEMVSPTGIGLLRSDALVWPLLRALLVTVLLVEAVNVAEIFLIRDTLSGSATAFGLVQAVSAAGALGGAWAAGRVRRQQTRWRAVATSMAAAGAGIAGAGLAPNVAMAGLAFAGIGFTFALANATFFPALMLRTLNADRGAVQAAVMGLGRAATLGGLGLGAVAGAGLDPRTVFLGSGILITVGCGWVATRVFATTRSDVAALGRHGVDATSGPGTSGPGLAGDGGPSGVRCSNPTPDNRP